MTRPKHNVYKTAKCFMERFKTNGADIKLKKNILVAGIIRGKKTIIPGGDDVILADDRVVVVSSEHKLSDLADILR